MNALCLECRGSELLMNALVVAVVLAFTFEGSISTICIANARITLPFSWFLKWPGAQCTGNFIKVQESRVTSNYCTVRGVFTVFLLLFTYSIIEVAFKNWSLATCNDRAKAIVAIAAGIVYNERPSSLDGIQYIVQCVQCIARVRKYWTKLLETHAIRLFTYLFDFNVRPVGRVHRLLACLFSSPTDEIIRWIHRTWPALPNWGYSNPGNCWCWLILLTLTSLLTYSGQQQTKYNLSIWWLRSIDASRETME